MLADIAQELDRRHGLGPLEVVLDNRTGGRAVEVDEALQLAPDPLGPFGDGVGLVEGALTDVARVADHAGGAAGEHDRAVSGALKAPQRQQRHQVSGVQAGRGGVEAGVHRRRPAPGFGSQRIEVGGLRDQPPPAQLVEDLSRHPARL